MSATLYRTYRPTTFAEVIGQQHIVTTLQNAITADRIAHAYLFTGPRGTGKTTLARIFADAVNATRADGTPMPDDIRKRLASGQSLDIIEIDAASNTGVDNIRSLRETVALAPSEARYKVYIIDEVHMLSIGAFNALLKTLEEPPAHVIFILATTDVHKVPATILSRCQRFDFARFPVSEIVHKLTAIAKKEKVDIAPEAVEMIALAADGGMRDAESLLAQIFALEDKHITADEVRRILGTTDAQDLLALLAALSTGATMDTLTIITRIAADGYNMETLIRALIVHMRTMLYIVASGNNTDDDAIHAMIPVTHSDLAQLRTYAAHLNAAHIIVMIEECTSALAKSRTTTIPQLPLEVAAVRICAKTRTTDTPGTEPPTTPPSDTGTPQHTTSAPQPRRTPAKRKTTTSTTTTPSAATSAVTMTAAQSAQPTDAAAFADTWQSCVCALDAAEHKTLAQLLEQCTAHLTDARTVTLSVPYTFYKDKITEHGNRALIEDALKTCCGRPLKITATVDAQENTQSSSELLSYATQLMGGTSVAEHT